MKLKELFSKEEKYKSANRKIAYFRNGQLYDVYPRTPESSLYDDREIAYQADVYISDGKIYDLLDCSDITALPIPNQQCLNLLETSAVFDLSYILKIYCCSRTGLDFTEIIPSLASKCFEIMCASRVILWTRRDYLRVIRCFWEFNLPEKGNDFEQRMMSEYPDCFLSISESVGYTPCAISEEEWLIKAAQRDQDIDEEHEREKQRLLKKWKIHSEYFMLKKMFPDLMPKNATAYSQIRTKNTKKYQLIREYGENKGFTFFDD